MKYIHKLNFGKKKECDTIDLKIGRFYKKHLLEYMNKFYLSYFNRIINPKDKEKNI